MIPKVLHFCWISGDPYPEMVKRCIDSWSAYLPDFRIELWDKERVLEVGGVWCREAIETKRYAFAADYIRLYALYHMGGVYLDSDVEVLRPIDHLLALPYFVGFENVGDWLEMAVIGAERGNRWVKQCLDYYQRGRLHFVNPIGYYRISALPYIAKQRLRRRFSLIEAATDSSYEDKEGAIYVQPLGFCIHPDSNRQYQIERHTLFIHHYAASWHDSKQEVPHRNAMQELLFFFYKPMRRLKRWLIGKPLPRG